MTTKTLSEEIYRPIYAGKVIDARDVKEKVQNAKKRLEEGDNFLLNKLKSAQKIWLDEKGTYLSSIDNAISFLESKRTNNIFSEEFGKELLK